MKTLVAVLSLALVAIASGCSSTPMLGQVTPWPSTSAQTTTPWMTTYGCDADMAKRMGKNC